MIPRIEKLKRLVRLLSVMTKSHAGLVETLQREVALAQDNSNSPRVNRYLANCLLAQRLVISIDPQVVTKALTKVTTVAGRKVLNSDWLLVPSSWTSVTFDDLPTSRVVQHLIEVGPAYRDKDMYSLLVERFRREGAFSKNGRRFASVQDIQAYFEGNLALIEDIKRNGYKSELPVEGRDPYVGLAVAEDGSVWHFQKGHHRLAAARRLGMSSIPAQVRVIHPSNLFSDHGRPRQISNLIKDIQVGRID